MKMKLTVLLCTLFMAGCMLSSCSKDDDNRPSVSVLKKLTQVTCVKNGSTLFSSDILYDSKGDLIRVLHDRIGSDRSNYSYLYNGNIIAVSAAVNGGDAVSFRKYTLSNEHIAKEEQLALNGNVEYANYEYQYNYAAGCLRSISWKEFKPKDGGAGFDEESHRDAFICKWSDVPDRNLESYTEYRTQSAFEYGKEACPVNFTFRPNKEMDFVAWECFDPINLLYGSSSNRLPTSAWTTNKGIKIADYSFTYESTGDYITSMNTTLVLYDKNNGNALITDRYQYTFKYE